MNVARVEKQIRSIGYNYGMPVWLIEFGFGARMESEAILKKLAVLGARKGDWVTLLNGVGEKGIAILVSGLRYASCRVEVEFKGLAATPGWFNQADKWTVWYHPQGIFNYLALRKGYDMLLCEAKDLDSMIEKFGNKDILDKGVIGEVGLDKIWEWRIRNYK